MKKEKAFRNWAANRIHLTFPNGNSISTVWGYGTYSDNYDMNEVDPLKRWDTFAQSNTVEVMIMNAPKKLIKKINKKFKTSESVIGRINIIDWLWVVNQLAK